MKSMQGGGESISSILHVRARATTVTPGACLSINVKDPADEPVNVNSGSVLDDLRSPRHVVATRVLKHGWIQVSSCRYLNLPFLQVDHNVPV